MTSTIGNMKSKNSSEKWEACINLVATKRDMEAFEIFFQHFGPQIKSFAYKMSTLQANESIAEELVQESMLKIWTKADSYDPACASVGTWVFTIARNTRIDLLRKYDRHSRYKVANDLDDEAFDVDDIWIENQDNDPFEQASRQRLKKTIGEHLEEIPNEQAFILSKIYMEGKSHSEIAEELELPLGTVKSRVRLGLKKLSQSLGKQVV